MDILPQSILSPDSATKALPDETIFLRFSLKSYAGRPFYEGMAMEGIKRMPADPIVDEDSNISPSFGQIKEYACRWCDATIVRVDTLRKLEQWIPFGYLQREFPIYKFHYGDKDKHQLYVSSVSGEALQFTNKSNRFWAWLGAIPHWVYFTSLRQNSQLWMDVVIGLSGVGSIMCITGLIVGIHSYVKQYRRKKRWETPYKKFAYKWHHILGFVFGIFVFTFVFSGMMSLANVPQWMVKVHNSSIRERMYLPQPVILDNYKLDIQKVLAAYHGEVKSVEWASFGQIPLYKVVVNGQQLTIDASEDNVKLLNLNEQDITTDLSGTHTEPMIISLMAEYDNYYAGKEELYPLPVYKVEVADADNSTYYINPQNGNTQYFNTNSKVHRWTYQALHSFKLGFLVKRPVLWNIIMWTTMIGGTLVSLTGCWLGVKYVRRLMKSRKRK